jgi:hypothetical protein
MRRSMGERVLYELNHAPASITKRATTSPTKNVNGPSTLPASCAGSRMASTVSVRRLVAYAIDANTPRLSTGNTTNPSTRQRNWR